MPANEKRADTAGVEMVARPVPGYRWSPSMELSTPERAAKRGCRHPEPSARSRGGAEFRRFLHHDDVATEML